MQPRAYTLARERTDLRSKAKSTILVKRLASSPTRGNSMLNDEFLSRKDAAFDSCSSNITFSVLKFSSVTPTCASLYILPSSHAEQYSRTSYLTSIILPLQKSRFESFVLECLTWSFQLHDL